MTNTTSPASETATLVSAKTAEKKARGLALSTVAKIVEVREAHLNGQTSDGADAHRFASIFAQIGDPPEVSSSILTSLVEWSSKFSVVYESFFEKTPMPLTTALENALRRDSKSDEARKSLCETLFGIALATLETRAREEALALETMEEEENYYGEPIRALLAVSPEGIKRFSKPLSGAEALRFLDMRYAAIKTAKK